MEDEANISIKDLTKYVLEEARMVLPGIQALFGFQLIAVFNNRFMELDESSKFIHLFAIVLTAIAIALVMAPAAYHRQVEPETASLHFVRYAGRLICYGMIPLLFSMSLDIYIIAKLISGNLNTAALTTLAVMALPTWLWYLVPQFERKKLMEKKERAKLASEDCLLKGV